MSTCGHNRTYVYIYEWEHRTYTHVGRVTLTYTYADGRDDAHVYVHNYEHVREGVIELTCMYT